MQRRRQGKQATGVQRQMPPIHHWITSSARSSIFGAMRKEHANALFVVTEAACSPLRSRTSHDQRR
jgi:hypothetical protein